MDWPELRGIKMRDCRDCAGPIRFVKLDNGTALPVDPMPNPDGNVCAQRVAGRLIGYVTSHDHGPDPRLLRMMPHAATCENRTKPKSRPAGPPTLF